MLKKIVFYTGILMGLIFGVIGCGTAENPNSQDVYKRQTMTFIQGSH
uniref:Uncharacterized protein n=1 Tax=Candidatus Enterococcus clewellii TaxID=1834193 RepID=A0A242K3V0_9ENTE|nr:hypothetical protein A5888_003153 [Enterococcus sp. 9E7_DIV0242]